MQARNAVLMMGSFLLSRLLGLVREQVVAGRLGTSPDYDAYLAAFRVPDFLYLVIMGGALGSALIPVLAEHRARSDAGSAQDLTNTVLTVATLAVLGLAAMAWLAADPLMAYVVAPGLDTPQQRLAAQVTRILLLSPVVLGMAGVVMAYLNAHHRFLGPALAPLAYNLSIILAAVILVPPLGVTGLAVGVVAGALLNLVVQVPELVSLGYRFRPTLHLTSPGFRKVANLLLPRMFGQAAYQANFVVITAIASTLVVGSISALNYAYLLMMLPHGLFAMSIAVSTFPVMAELVATGRTREMQEVVVRALSSVLFLALPSAIGLSLLGAPLVRLLFEGGAFNTASTEMVSQALRFLAFGVIPYGAVEVLTRAFYAFGDTRRPVVAGLVTVVFNVALGAALSRVMLHAGLALALVLATAVEMLVMAAMLSRYLAWGWLAPTILELAKASLASVALVFFLLMAITLGGDLIDGRRGAMGPVGLAGTVLLGAAVYMGVALALRGQAALELARVPANLLRRAISGT
jgi:putative peptidoglycan lipid II flippase